MLRALSGLLALVGLGLAGAGGYFAFEYKSL